MESATDEEQERARRLIGGIVDRTGLSVTEVARRAGVSPSTLSRIFPVPVVKYTLSARTIGKLQTAFPDMGAADQHPAPGQAGVQTQSAPKACVSETREMFRGESGQETSAPIYRLITLPPDLRDESFELEAFIVDMSEPVGEWTLPIATHDRDRYFVVYVAGEAMAPRIKAGEAILVDRIKPPHVSSDVVVEFTRGERTLFCIGTLTGLTRDHLTIEQPKFELMRDIGLDSISGVFLIVGRFIGPLKD